MSTWIEAPRVLETMDDAATSVKAREEKEDQTETREIVVLKAHLDELRGNTRKKKKRWKISLEMQKFFENYMGTYIKEGKQYEKE